MTIMTNQSAAELQSENEALKIKVRLLIDAGNAVMQSLGCPCPYGESVYYCSSCVKSWETWRKLARETNEKP